MLSPVADFLSVYASHGALSTSASDARFSLFLRGAILFGLIIAMLTGGKIRRSGLYLSLLVCVAILSSGAAYALDIASGPEFGQQSIFVLKVFSFFVYFRALSELGDRRLAKLEWFVRLALLAYGICIVAGAALSIEMFRSYQADTHIRSGYKGIVYAQNEASALVTVGLAFAYLGGLRSGWRVREILLAGILLAASMLIGTKGAVIGALGVTCAYFYARHNAFRATARAALVLGTLAALAILAYVTIPNIQQAVDLTLNYFEYQGGRASSDRLLTILLSGRNLKFANVWDGVAQHNYIALLTGGYPVTRYMVEIDIPDLVLTLGLPAFVAYFMALRGAFVYSGKPCSTTRFGKLFFYLIVAVAATAGHVFGSALVAPFLAFIAVIVKRYASSGSQQGNLDVVR
ncbi:O-antigen ligase family protein [Paraburkholderia sediminicola]|uniref:O-antigen ligase family protein n=1 Tax=Paraburkholderia rhynchosiae TaxID=487049 RepID=A0ACC7NEB8_9BURK